jgi:hypothetical protein
MSMYNADGLPSAFWYPSVIARDPVEDESLDWSADNEWQQQCEERAYAEMDSHNPRWLDWLVNVADSADTARLLSLYLLGNPTTPEVEIERSQLAANLRKDYIDHLVNHD